MGKYFNHRPEHERDAIAWEIEQEIEAKKIDGESVPADYAIKERDRISLESSDADIAQLVELHQLVITTLPSPEHAKRMLRLRNWGNIATIALCSYIGIRQCNQAPPPATQNTIEQEPASSISHDDARKADERRYLDDIRKRGATATADTNSSRPSASR